MLLSVTGSSLRNGSIQWVGCHLTNSHKQ